MGLDPVGGGEKSLNAAGGHDGPGSSIRTG